MKSQEPGGKSLSLRTNLHVLVVDLGPESPQKPFVENSMFCKQSVMYRTKFIRSVTVKNRLITDVGYYLVICVSKEVILHSHCNPVLLFLRKVLVLKGSPTTNLQDLVRVFVLEP